MSCIIKQIKTASPLTKSNLPLGDFSANPYIGCTHACKYCYACFMKRFTNHPEPWGEFLDVKLWDKIKNPEKYNQREIFIGSATDPYNQYEKEFCRTRALLEQLEGSGAKINILTKSDLVLRDLELIKKFKNPRVGWSINTLDEDFRSDMDNAVPIAQRLDAMKRFYDEGVTTVCFISPIFPAITDVFEIIERAKGFCNYIWLENLNLRGSFKHSILSYISKKHPSLVPLYNEIYSGGNRSFWKGLDDEVSRYCSQNGLLYVTNEDFSSRPHSAPPVVVNFFYHEQIKKSAVKNANSNQTMLQL